MCQCVLSCCAFHWVVGYKVVTLQCGDDTTETVSLPQCGGSLGLNSSSVPPAFTVRARYYMQLTSL